MGSCLERIGAIVVSAASLGAVGCTTPLTPVNPGADGALTELDRGYTTLATLLGDERKVHQILPLKGEGLPVRLLTQEIASASAAGHDALKALCSLDPPVDLESSVDLPMIEQATRDSIAAKTTLDLLFSDDTFETRLLISQAQALRYGHFLAVRLGQADPNPARREWLESFAKEYEGLYKKVVEALHPVAPDQAPSTPIAE